MSEQIIRELAKLSTKMDVMCGEISELKEFNKTAIRKLTMLEERLKSLEEWKEEVTEYSRLKQRFSYDLRSAVAGGIAGGVFGMVGGLLIRLVFGGG